MCVSVFCAGWKLWKRTANNTLQKHRWRPAERADHRPRPTVGDEFKFRSRRCRRLDDDDGGVVGDVGGVVVNGGGSGGGGGDSQKRQTF